MNGTRLRPRLAAPRIVILVEAALAIAVIAYLLSHEYIKLPLIGGSHYELRAEFTDAAGLSGQNHSTVAIAGVAQGRVTAVSYRGGHAVATLELQPSARGKVFADAQVRIVPRSALQDLIVDIMPGSPGARALASGATIPPSQTSSTVGFDKLVDTLDADTRAELQIMLGQLSAGLAGRAADLRPGLVQLGRVVDVGTQVTSQLAERRTLLVRMVSELDSLATELGARDQYLATALEFGRRTLATTATRGTELTGTVRLLPSTLSAVAGAMAALHRLAPPLESALTGLRPVARELPGALGALRAFVPSGEGLVHDLSALTTGAARPVRDLKAMLGALRPAAGALRRPVSDLLPILTPINDARSGIGQVGDNFSGVFSTNDVNGPILRGLGFFESFDPQDVGFPAGARGAVLAKAETDSVLALTRVCLHANPVACLVRYLIPGLPGAVAPAILTPVSGLAK